MEKDKNYPLVSIVVSSYNNTEYLEECFESIHIQKYESYEIVFCDDCSKNLDKEDIKRRIESIINPSLHTIKYIFQEKNLGTVKNLNIAFKKCSGEIIVDLAIDDMLFDENTLSYIIEKFDDPKCMIATSLRQNIYPDGSLKDLRPSKKERKLFSNQKKLKNQITYYGNFIGGCNTYYRKSLFDAVGYFDESYKLLEDLPFLAKTLNDGHSIYLINEKCLKYRYGGVSNGEINPLLKSDMLHYYDNLLRIEKKIHKRRIAKYSKKKLNAGRIKKILLSLLYFDVVLLKLLKKV